MLWNMVRFALIRSELAVRNELKRHFWNDQAVTLLEPVLQRHRQFRSRQQAIRRDLEQWSKYWGKPSED